MSKPAHLIRPDALIVWAAVADRFDHGSQPRLGFKSYRPLTTPQEAANTAHLPRYSPNLDARSDCHRPNKGSTSQCVARTARPPPFVYNFGPEGTRPSSSSHLDLWFTHRESARITESSGGADQAQAGARVKPSASSSKVRRPMTRGVSTTTCSTAPRRTPGA